MTTDTHPGDAEYHAAVAGMTETYGGRTVLRNGRLITSYAVGDRIMWRDQFGDIRRGVVVEVLTEDTYHVRSHIPDHGNVHFAVREEDTLPF
jgi:hypothetical protein